MNAWGVIVIWGIVQVTAIALFAIGCYALLRNRAPAARSQVIVVGLCVTLLVSILALSPWPRWVSLSPANNRAELSQVAAVQDDVRPSREATESPALTAAQATTESKRDDANSAAVARTFWQAFLRGLSEAPPSAAIRSSLRWPAFVLLALALAAAVGAVRLLLGLWGVRQLRSGSQIVADTGLHDEIERLRRDLGCRRAVEVRVSSQLASPVTVGWQRALVILPNDWKSWSHSELQTALAHEIAHVARNDYAWGLVAQLCLAANYYHPLVHWLARRLRLAQELAADAAAAAATGSRNDYLVTLARLALRCDDRPVAWASLLAITRLTPHEDRYAARSPTTFGAADGDLVSRDDRRRAGHHGAIGGRRARTNGQCFRCTAAGRRQIERRPEIRPRQQTDDRSQSSLRRQPGTH